jgi:hypothetical protein
LRTLQESGARNFGNKCAANSLPFINRCTYDQAEDLLSVIYGTLQPPNIPPSGRIVAFDQTEYVPGNAAKANGMPLVSAHSFNPTFV